MNYYEELGIRPEAGEEEIRKAHRRLVKIMHPDQHRDQALRQLAETQMRRLNSIVAVLLDPEERAEYDEQLRYNSFQEREQQRTWRSKPWWIASTVGAVVLTVGALWVWSDRIMGGTFTGRNPTVIEDTSAQSPAVPESTPPTQVIPQRNAQGSRFDETPAREKGADRSNTTVATVVTPAVKPKRTPATKAPGPSKPERRAVKTKAQRSAAAVPQQALETKPEESKKTAGELPLLAKADLPRPLTAPSTLDTESAAAGEVHFDIPNRRDFARRSSGARDPLEGEWVYAPTEPEKRESGLYPPEFIKLKLRKQADGIHGEYNARYNVADSRPVSPEVSFVLKSVDKNARKYVWTAADGRHGTFEIRELESDTMRLEWRTTGGRSGPALSSGIATLVRKN